MFNKNMKIPYGKHFISKEDINSVVEVLESDFLTQGPKIPEFESNFAKYVESKYAVAVCNATAALHLAAIALEVKPGQKIITTPISFVASANCIKYLGGEIDFVDIDPNTYLMDYNKLKLKLDSSPVGTYSGIILVDFAGYPVDIIKFKDLASKYNLWIIEDACHAPGAFIKGAKGELNKTGNSEYSDLTVFSFHPVKHIACGEGGMITTNNKTYYDKLIKLRSHGISKDKIDFQNSIEISGGINEFPSWYMEMQDLGFNFRLSDIHAALGISQLKRADIRLNKRIELAKYYISKLIEIPHIKMHSNVIEGHAYHLFVILAENRLGLYNFLRDNNILTQIHYFPIHLMPYYRNIGWKENDFLESENYYKKCLSIPIYPELEFEDLDFIISKIKEFYK
jgi:UDP-4-amino-4,6-dideoxy-N-acetyl-beta-L-altrosamine transaminase